MTVLNHSSANSFFDIISLLTALHANLFESIAEVLEPEVFSSKKIRDH